MEDMQVKVLVDGEWMNVTSNLTESEEFSATFQLKEAITPDALRFEFPQQRVELYEIEVY